MKILFLQDTSALQLDKKEWILFFLLLIFFFSLYMPGITLLYNVSMYFFCVQLFFNSIAEKWLLKKKKELILINSSPFLSQQWYPGFVATGWFLNNQLRKLSFKPLNKSGLLLYPICHPAWNMEGSTYFVLLSLSIFVHKKGLALILCANP